MYNSNEPNAAFSLKNRFDMLYRNYHNDHINDDVRSYYLSWNDMIDIVAKLKPGKSFAEFVTAEHVLYSCPELIIHLHLLFNALIQHSYVPCDFLKSVITPIVKDNEGDISSTDN